ncbi:MAG: hypothetical protein JO331_06475 [Verrucomicrobia bacterium]|nr:hypothetical protein [Verrucomicrobiota bacterium]
MAFNEADFATYTGPGTASVSGELICSHEGQNHPGQDSPVALLPVTAYTKEMIDRELGDGVTLVSYDPRLKKYVRITNTDDQGHFAFRDVPAGEYFVAGEAGRSPGGGGDDLHQWACERITVHKGQMVYLRATHNPQHGDSRSIISLRSSSVAGESRGVSRLQSPVFFSDPSRTQLVFRAFFRR